MVTILTTSPRPTFHRGAPAGRAVLREALVGLPGAAEGTRRGGVAGQAAGGLTWPNDEGVDGVGDRV